MRYIFNIDNNNQIECFFSVTGLEQYYLNGEEIYQIRDFSFRLHRQFSISIKGQTKVVTLKSKLLGLVVQVFVNESLFIDNLLNKKYRKGFQITWVELIIIVAIIGILASIAMPASCVSYIARATVLESLIATTSLKKEVENYYLMHKKYPDKQSIIHSELFIDTDKSQVSLSTQGAILIAYREKAHFNLRYETLILTPHFSESGFRWDCLKGSLNKQFKPQSCLHIDG